jgi:large subunit ribosomal protein L10
MTRIEKESLVKSLVPQFEKSGAIIIGNYKSLTVTELENLRKVARENNVKVQVIKNSLVKVALKESKINGLTLKNMNIFLWGSDAINTAKVAFNFSEKNEKFKLVNSYIDGNVVEANKVEVFAKSPGKKELLGMLASVWMAPIRNFTIGINALKEKKEQVAN